jgi:hypothetical protein
MTAPRIRGYITNHYLNWENIRSAALADDFTLIQVGYFRNKQVAGPRLESNKARPGQNFIAWAVAQLQSRCPEKISKRALLSIWDALPLPTRLSMGSAQEFFRSRCGVKLTMEGLQELAFPNSPAPWQCVACASVGGALSDDARPHKAVMSAR